MTASGPDGDNAAPASGVEGATGKHLSPRPSGGNAEMLTHRTSGHRSGHALSAVLLAAALALAGCSAASDSASDKSAAGAEAAARQGADEDAKGGAAAPGGAADAAAGEAGGRATAPPKLPGAHVIRTASLTVRVKDVPKALEEARTAAEDAGGIVGNETTGRDDRGREHSRVVLRVPQERYGEVLTALQGTGRLVERQVKAQDVTDQVVDVDSRIATQRASVARIRELMDRATKLSDVVTLEGELSARQADLESLLAQQASLKDRASLATVTLSLSERPVRRAAQDDDPGFVDALEGGWDAFVTMLRWIMVALGAVLPFAAAVALLVLLWLKAVRPKLPRRAEPAPAGRAGAETREAD